MGQRAGVCDGAAEFGLQHGEPGGVGGQAELVGDPDGAADLLRGADDLADALGAVARSRGRGDRVRGVPGSPAGQPLRALRQYL